MYKAIDYNDKHNERKLSKDTKDEKSYSGCIAADLLLFL